ncbi:MAG: hypothetical protein RL701_4636 [Pseudomonadota bacterium]
MSVLHSFCKLACAGSLGACMMVGSLHAQTPADPAAAPAHAKPKPKHSATKTTTPTPPKTVAAAQRAPGPQPPPAGLIDPQPQPSAADKKSAPSASKTKTKAQPPAAGSVRAPDSQPLAAASPKTKPAVPPSAAAPEPPPKPACSIVDPEQPRGGRLEVVGEAFGAVPVVRISGKPARILERRSERVSVQIPPDSNGGAITVQQEGRVLECGTLLIIGKNR